MITGIIIILSIIALDQLSKYLVFFLMEEGQTITVIKDFFYIASTRNFGAAWSSFQGQKIFLIIISIVALVFFFYYFKDVNFKTKKVYSISLSMMIGGTIGNLICRLTNHGVIDFFKFIIFGYNYPVFNIADISLVLGIIGFAIDIIFFDKEIFFKEKGAKNERDT